MEKEGQAATETPLSCGEDQKKLAEGDSSLPSGHAALPHQDQTRELWEGLQLEWSRTLGGLSGRDPTPSRDNLN